MEQYLQLKTNGGKRGQPPFSLKVHIKLIIIIYNFKVKECNYELYRIKGRYEII